MLRTNEILKSAPEFFAADIRPTWPPGLTVDDEAEPKSTPPGHADRAPHRRTADTAGWVGHSGLSRRGARCHHRWQTTTAAVPATVDPVDLANLGVLEHAP